MGLLKWKVLWMDFADTSRSAMPATPEVEEPITTPAPVIEPKTKPETDEDPGYLVICWNDPVNLMAYVTHVFQKVFGWERKKAETHMMEVHNQGRSVLVRESFEKAEFYVHELHKYSLQATMEPAK